MTHTLAFGPGTMLNDYFDTLDTDGTVKFYQTVQACQVATNAREVLDFGAGRGGGIVAARAAGNSYKAFLQDLRSLGARVTACDVDDAVRAHPAADDIALIDSDGALPFADESFDLIVSDNTFEHIARPEQVARELLRVLRPGGYICARTPNKHGYVAVAARLVPGSLYGFVLRKAQPGRDDHDKFPVEYKLNDLASLRRHFAGATVAVRYPHVEPSYFFNSAVIKAGMQLVHALTPSRLRPVMIVLVRKN
jgi:SAM-dependent methyltransferase